MQRIWEEKIMHLESQINRLQEELGKEADAYNDILTKFIDLKMQAEIIAEYILDELPNSYDSKSEYVKNIEEVANTVLEITKKVQG